MFGERKIVHLNKLQNMIACLEVKLNFKSDKRWFETFQAMPIAFKICPPNEKSNNKLKNL